MINSYCNYIYKDELELSPILFIKAHVQITNYINNYFGRDMWEHLNTYRLWLKAHVQITN